MHPTIVKLRIGNPSYAAMEKVNRKWRKMKHEPIVSFDEWKAKTKAGELMAQMKKVWEINRNKILACLGIHEKTILQIVSETGITDTTIGRHLKLLVKEGLVERIPSERERKGGPPFLYIWRIRAGEII